MHLSSFVVRLSGCFELLTTSGKQPRIKGAIIAVFAAMSRFDGTTKHFLCRFPITRGILIRCFGLRWVLMPSEHVTRGGCTPLGAAALSIQRSPGTPLHHVKHFNRVQPLPTTFHARATVCCVRLQVNVDNNCVGFYQSMYLGSFCTQTLIDNQFSYQVCAFGGTSACEYSSLFFLE